MKTDITHQKENLDLLYHAIFLMMTFLTKHDFSKEEISTSNILFCFVLVHWVVHFGEKTME